jgi:pimeloyl-ACP methyl ester carboxylesterase
MAHGFGATREGRLWAYAERFQDAGLGVLVFDYRHFGASEGEPRQLLAIARQLEDWRAAVEYARSRPDVDAARVALWGSSLSGGHVIATAADAPGVAAVIAQVPFVAGLATLRQNSPAQILRLTAAGLRDELARRVGREPEPLAIVGPPGSLAVMTTPDAEPGYQALYPPEVEWENHVAARIALRVGLYRPGARASEVRCPLLVAVGEQDGVTPPGPAIEVARRAPRGELAIYPLGHFDVYRGEPFERVVGDEIEFLLRHLRPATVGEPAGA